MSSGNTTKILGGVAIFLMVVAAGFFAFTQYEQHAYVKQAAYAEEVASDARDVALECEGLSGNPESDDAKDLLKQLDTVQSNLKETADTLKSARTGSKYRTANTDLVEALILEENILEDVQRVVKDPSGENTNVTIARVKQNVEELRDRGLKITIDKTDFASAFDLKDLDGLLSSYAKKHRMAVGATKAAAAKAADVQNQAMVANFKARLQGRWGKPRTDLDLSYDNVGLVVPNEPGPDYQKPFSRYAYRSIQNVTYDADQDTYTADVTFSDGKTDHLVIRGNTTLEINGSIYQRMSGSAHSSTHAVVDK
ncbi:hypothetical protein [Mitsuokella jalaludinii]|uniref:hypothetical protein n=1 Tax=Mitsuokella jalaludinii TaxID=187979 RepID=UPI0022E220E8|nr:hypothetical protein [Mitsuokella jalaludinii]